MTGVEIVWIFIRSTAVCILVWFYIHKFSMVRIDISALFKTTAIVFVVVLSINGSVYWSLLGAISNIIGWVIAKILLNVLDGR